MDSGVPNRGKRSVSGSPLEWEPVGQADEGNPGAAQKQGATPSARRRPCGIHRGGTHGAGFMGAPQPDLEPWQGWNGPAVPGGRAALPRKEEGMAATVEAWAKEATLNPSQKRACHALACGCSTRHILALQRGCVQQWYPCVVTQWRSHRVQFRPRGLPQSILEIRGRWRGRTVAQVRRESGAERLVRRWTVYSFHQADERDRVWDIWVLPLSGDRKPFPVVQTPYNETHAQFSPDGRWIVYASNESGKMEIYAQPFRGNQATATGTRQRVQITNGGGAQPRWRNDRRVSMTLRHPAWEFTDYLLQCLAG